MHLVLLSILTSLCLVSKAAEYRYHFCSNRTTFPPNSTYQSNLSHLLSFLSANSTSETGFYNTTAGQTQIPESTVYSLFLCQDCVPTATKEIVQLHCPDEKVGVIWYDECVLRYSNRSFFFVMGDEPQMLVEKTLSDLVPVAANALSGAEKFATKETKFTELQTLYSLVECTPDKSSFDCNRCLQGAIAKLSKSYDGKTGSRVVSPSCNIRYEVFAFYHIQSQAVAAQPKGKGKILMVIAIVIGVTIAASVVLVFLLYCFRRRKARKKSNATNEKNSGKSDGLLIYHCMQVVLS